MAQCNVCFRHCEISEGETGFCGGRVCQGGKTETGNYGRITSLALDPIEKKPLRRFFPGSMILSVGSYGCNLRCPFCQNCGISWSKEAFEFAQKAEILSPEELAACAVRFKSHGNIGLAFTYNEPLIGYEFVRDTAKLIHQSGMQNVLVTNGTVELPILDELAPWIDAMNIDLKGFSEHYYKDVLGGNLGMVKAFISKAVQFCHVELTTLIVPGENDSAEEMRELSRWISRLKNPDGESVPLHVSRFFPRFHMQDRQATEIRTVRFLASVASEFLEYVYTGNC